MCPCASGGPYFAVPTDVLSVVYVVYPASIEASLDIETVYIVLTPSIVAYSYDR